MLSRMGKRGVALVSTTIHGNLILGSTAIDIEEKEETNTTCEGHEFMLVYPALDVEQ